MRLQVRPLRLAWTTLLTLMVGLQRAGPSPSSSARPRENAGGFTALDLGSVIHRFVPSNEYFLDA